jgi:hypothetical protein
VFERIFNLCRRPIQEDINPGSSSSQALTSFRHQQGYAAQGGEASSRLSQALMKKKEQREAKPAYHAPCMPLPRLFALHNADSYLRCNREVEDRHFGASWLGPVSSGGAWQSVVRDWSRRSCDQSKWNVFLVHQQMYTNVDLALLDLGFGFGRTQTLSYRPHISCAWA